MYLGQGKAGIHFVDHRQEASMLRYTLANGTHV